MLPTVVTLSSLIKYTVKLHSLNSCFFQAILSFFFKQRHKASHQWGNWDRKPWSDFSQAGNSAGCRNCSCNPCSEECNSRPALTSLRPGFHSSMISKTKGILKSNSVSGFIFLACFFVWLVWGLYSSVCVMRLLCFSLLFIQLLLKHYF